MTRRPAPLDAATDALFLDVDGTLLAIESHPDAVVADAHLRELLDTLARRLDGALALVSGRTVGALDRMFAPLCLPAAGAHGSELRISDVASRDAAHELPAHARKALEAFAAAHEGVLLEPKPGGASLHYRRAPALEEACRRFMAGLLDDLRSEYRVIDGKMVLELAPRAASKGEAILSLMRETPFAGRRPVFVGDDVTDEDGFRAVNSLGGVSVRVGALDDSTAKWSLADIAAVREWLHALAATNPDDTGDSAVAQP
ncbi:MAG TPA: trehalose-phosphatase [Woeseiaceae bacterium]|nr:trehalose-phosphatase [Woeseiaceae bacterium]